MVLSIIKVSQTFMLQFDAMSFAIMMMLRNDVCFVVISIFNLG